MDIFDFYILVYGENIIGKFDIYILSLENEDYFILFNDVV